MVMKTFYYYGKRKQKSTLKHKIVGEDGKVYVYGKAKDFLFYGAQIGHEYRFDDDEALPKNWKDAKTGNVHEKAEMWQAECRLDLQRNKAKNVKQSPELLAHVEALRSACNYMSANERAYFLTWLITQFMSWKR